MALAAPFLFVSGIPGQVGAPTPTAGNASVSLAFTPLTSTAVAGYIATPYIAGVAQAAQTLGSTSPVVATGLTNGTAYTFTLTAYNAYGRGPPSAVSASATPVFSLASITGLRFWFNAGSASTTSSSGALTAWKNDASGASGTVAGTVNYLASGTMTWPCAQLASGSSYMLQTATDCMGTNWGVNGTSTYTLFYVVQIPSGGVSGGRLFELATSTSGQDTAAESQNMLSLYNTGSTCQSFRASTGNLAQITHGNVPSILNHQVTSSQIRNRRLNGGSDATTWTSATVTVNVSAGVDRFAINFNQGQTTNGYGGNLEVYEAIVYDSVLSSTDSASVISYLQAKYDGVRGIAGFRFWFDAGSASTTASAGALTGWKNDVTGVDGTYSGVSFAASGTIAGKPCVKFPTSSAYMYQTTTGIMGANWGTGGNSTYSLFIVVYFPSGGVNVVNGRVVELALSTSAQDSSNDAKNVLSLLNNGATYTSFYTFRGGSGVAAVTHGNAASILEHQVTGSTIRNRKLNGGSDSTTWTSSSTTVNVSSGVDRVAFNYAQGQGSPGGAGNNLEVYETLIYDSVLSSTDSNTVISYLRAKYSL